MCLTETSVHMCMLFTCCVSAELKKDPGIPNLYPFKEQLLQQIEDRRQQVGQLCVGGTCALQVVLLCGVSQCFLCEVKNGELVTECWRTSQVRGKGDRRQRSSN